MSADGFTTYLITLRVPTGDDHAVELAEKLADDVGADRVTVRDVDPVTGREELPFYVRADA